MMIDLAKQNFDVRIQPESLLPVMILQCRVYTTTTSSSSSSFSSASSPSPSSISISFFFKTNVLAIMLTKSVCVSVCCDSLYRLLLGNNE